MELYIHIPFCRKKCVYCDFCSFAGREGDIPAYLDAIAAEAREYPALRFSTVFVGGGTPSLLPPGSIRGLFSRLSEIFTIERGAEFTFEANPGTLDAQKLEAMREAGATRLSLGVQSLNADILKFLGRIHSAEDFFSSVELAKAAGFPAISADIITGVPGQSVSDVADAARRIADAGVTHISAYSLQVEEGTPLSRLRVAYPGEEEERELFYAAADTLESMGYSRYETSNFALPGFACAHNMGYWTGEEYLGLGVSAASLMDGVRFSNSRDLSGYLAGRYGREYQPLTERDKKLEYIMLRLRLSSGIELSDYKKRFGEDFAAVFSKETQRCGDAGLINVTAQRITPTRRGFDLQNALIGEFVNNLL